MNMPMNLGKHALIAAGLCVLFPAWCFGIESQPTISCAYQIKPSLVRQQDGGDYTGGLEFDAYAVYENFHEEKDLSYRKSLRAELRTEGILTGDKDRNPRPLRAEFVAAGAIHLSGPKISDLGPNPGEEVVRQEAFDHGRVGAGLNIGYETDQALDNRNATAGGELSYVMVQHSGWKALVPSLHAQYEWVSVDRSEPQRAMHVDDGGYQRYRASASWKMPVGDLLPGPLAPLQVHLDVRYSRDLGRPDAVAQAGLDESRYVAGALSYTFRDPVPLGTVSGVFIKVSRGRIPPAVDRSMNVYLGFILWEK